MEPSTEVAPRSDVIAVKAETESAPVAPRPTRSGHWLLLLARYGTLVGFAVMLVYFSLTTDAFFTASNFGNVLKASAAAGVIAIGLTAVLILGDFDLSIGYTATAAGMLAAGTAQTFGMAGGTLAALLLGLCVGIANGMVVTRLGVSAFIATLGAGQIIAGWLLAYRGGVQVAVDLPDDFSTLGRGSVGPVPNLVIIWLLVAVAAWLFFERTVIGRRMYAVGGNPVASELSGINNSQARLFAFALSGMLAGLAGLMVTSSLGVGNPTSALSYLLPAFAACFIGAATLREGQFHIGGTLVGVLMLSFLANGLVVAGVERAWTTAAQGIVLIAAVTISTFARRIAAR